MQGTTDRLLSGYSMQISTACKGNTVCSPTHHSAYFWQKSAAVSRSMHLIRHSAAACPLTYLHRPLNVPATSSLFRRWPHCAIGAEEELERQQAGSWLSDCRWARPVSASLTDADCQKPSNALEDDLSTIEDDDSPGWRCSNVLAPHICSMLLLCPSCCCHQPGH